VDGVVVHDPERISCDLLKASLLAADGGDPRTLNFENLDAASRRGNIHTYP
jgi:hypothetical protein